MILSRSLWIIHVSSAFWRRKSTCFDSSSFLLADLPHRHAIKQSFWWFILAQWHGRSFSAFFVSWASQIHLVKRCRGSHPDRSRRLISSYLSHRVLLGGSLSLLFSLYRSIFVSLLLSHFSFDIFLSCSPLTSSFLQVNAQWMTFFCLVFFSPPNINTFLIVSHSIIIIVRLQFL